jgi:hypothetical protein
VRKVWRIHVSAGLGHHRGGGHGHAALPDPGRRGGHPDKGRTVPEHRALQHRAGPAVLRTAAATSTITLAAGFPADGRYLRISVDDRDRILSETVVHAKHITRRTFVYPVVGQE